MKRTTDYRFFSCPICGERPYIKVIDINYGIAYCKGKLFRKHPIIQVSTGYCKSSELYQKLANGWAYSHWESLNMLPIRINMEKLEKENENDGADKLHI